VTVAVLEGHGALRRRLVLAVEADDDLHVIAEAADAAAGAAMCAEFQPRCVVVGVGDDPAAVVAVRAACPPVAVILVVTPADADAAVEGLRAGARGFVNREALAQLPAVVRAVTGGLVALPPLLAAALLGSDGRSGASGVTLADEERAVLRQLAAGRSYRDAATATGIAEGHAKALVAGVVDRFQVPLADPRTGALRGGLGERAAPRRGGGIRPVE
jgi:DNA-binding NarL/FixJ family response regulator